MSGTHNWTIEQGANWSRRVTWLVADVAVNLTGYTARMDVRLRHSSADKVLALSSSPAAGITLGGMAGTIDLALTAAQTAAIGEGLYVYDLELVSSTGVVTRLLEGTVTVTPETTRPAVV